MSTKDGIQKYGDKAIKVLYNEFLQLHDMEVFLPVYHNKLSKQQLKDALRAISVIKEKRDGTLKGRTCADGRKQKGWYEKSDTTSPTVYTDSVMLTSAIDAFEGRVVGTGDIKGAYLHTPQDDFTVIKFIGEQVDIMCSISSEYLQYIVMENGKKVLYLMLNHALYGTVRAALLWYNLLTSTLLKMGFKLNPYDLCVANSTINGK